MVFKNLFDSCYYKELTSLMCKELEKNLDEYKRNYTHPSALFPLYNPWTELKKCLQKYLPLLKHNHKIFMECLKKYALIQDINNKKYITMAGIFNSEKNFLEKVFKLDGNFEWER